jgi:hypothetical protein
MYCTTEEEPGSQPWNWHLGEEMLKMQVVNNGLHKQFSLYLLHNMPSLVNKIWFQMATEAQNF